MLVDFCHPFFGKANGKDKDDDARQDADSSETNMNSIALERDSSIENLSKRFTFDIFLCVFLFFWLYIVLSWLWFQLVSSSAVGHNTNKEGKGTRS